MSSKKPLSETGKRRLGTLINRLRDFNNHKQFGADLSREFERKKREDKTLQMLEIKPDMR